MKQAFRNWFLCVTAIAALLSLTAATYAWFTSNQEVSTTRASARTAEESLELQISSDGSTFSNASPVAIAQVNQTSLTNLLPVSTADLSTLSMRHQQFPIWRPILSQLKMSPTIIMVEFIFVRWAQGISSDTTSFLFILIRQMVFLEKM